MATTSVVRIKLTLDNNKTRTLELPSPVSDDLTDPETGYDLTSAAFNGVKMFYQTDSWASVVGAMFSVVNTQVTTVSSYENES